MSDSATAYRVLARKYRPSTFAELIGQEAMVRTLSNAIATGRIAHAFILTGVRGVGKTTTARILARAFNCIGSDGLGGPTPQPCGQCAHCLAIGEDRHADVVEMDAASRTGVDDIRDLTEGVRYRPVSGRYKVYIIDEVHMLSKNAFNALLKTLEEPPPDVKFIFATTEIHKVPVTVLSRCQRFALRRVPVEKLIEHYRRIAEAEGVEASPAALALIARAADGSVRDGLSLLDQAIALAAGRIEETAVRDMLGIADRGLVFDLLESVLRGDAQAALKLSENLYQCGADPLLVLQDLLDLSHFLTRLKLAPEAGAGDPIAEGERERARPLAEKLAMSVLARTWQMLLKGLEEVQIAPSPIRATEMLLVRLAYVAELPAPAELVRSVTARPSSEGVMAAPTVALAERQSSPHVCEPGPGASTTSAPVSPGSTLPSPAPPLPQTVSGQTTAGAAHTAIAGLPAAPPVVPERDPVPQSFTEVVALFDRRREALIRSYLWSHVYLVSFEPGRIEFRLAAGAPPDLANRLGQLLSEWTGIRWMIAVSEAEGEPSLHEQEQGRERELRNEVASHPLVRAVLETFPGAAIAAVRERYAAAQPESGELLLDDPGDEASLGEDGA
ncbi:MAG: DNA polymerase III subunit gamma/tau [Alphaproteobacteria bacterium]|nr:DNA polymerase III subunit gamma/tau [Alphaproteobacteria bacterium]